MAQINGILSMASTIVRAAQAIKYTCIWTDFCGSQLDAMSKGHEPTGSSVIGDLIFKKDHAAMVTQSLEPGR